MEDGFGKRFFLKVKGFLGTVGVFFAETFCFKQRFCARYDGLLGFVQEVFLRFSRFLLVCSFGDKQILAFHFLLGVTAS